MTVSWVIETGMEDDYEEALVASAKAAGCEVWHPKFIPKLIGGGVEGKIPDLPGTVVFHGTLQGALQVRELGLPWVVYENAEQLRCRYYYPRLLPMLLNRHHAFLPFGSIRWQWPWLLKTFGEDRCVFIRPDSNRKVFTGMLVRDDKREKDIGLMGFYDVPPEEMVVAARPQVITAEYRFFVTADRVITGSGYRRGQNTQRWAADKGELAVAEKHRQYCFKAGYCPDPVWVLDLCQLSDGEWRILEVGSFSSAGLYASDTDALVEEVSRLCTRP